MAINNYSSRAIFLDKDGTLTPDIPYNANPAKITLYPEVPAALAKLHRAGFKLIVVSNQSGVARGYMTEPQVQHMLSRLRNMLAGRGILLEGLYYCPHHPEGTVETFAQDCQCAKPQPGLLTFAAQRHELDLHQSWMIGDILDDVEAGNRAGCRAVLLDNGHETEWQRGDIREPNYIAHTLIEAANVIAGGQRRYYAR